MIKMEHTEVWGWEHAVRGMRNPMNSWEKSDSKFYKHFMDRNSSVKMGCVELGDNDLKLMKKLINGGTEHRKFLRQIFVSVDITAPLYWWKEFDTYKVGTVANSCSTMHKLTSRRIMIDDFSVDDFTLPYICDTIVQCEELRLKYVETKDSRYWRALIQLLPESYMQKRTITMNYENVLSMLHQRKYHKQTEWSEDFCGWVIGLPYAQQLFVLEGGESDG